MENTKVTKKQYFGMIEDIVKASEAEDKDAILAFISKEVDLLDARAEKAKERAAKKREESDELRKEILDLLTDKGQTGNDLVAAIGRKDVTKAKVTARMTQLVKNGLATKEVVKTEDKKKVTVYKLA